LYSLYLLKIIKTQVPMYKFLLLLSCATIAIISFGCKKKVTQSLVPVIEFKECNKYQIKAFDDSLQITISYADFDGDIGENNPNIKNLFLTDSRTQTVLEYRIKEIIPNKQTANIKGTLNVVIDKIYINSSAASEIVSYKIQLVDRAGNKSNEVLTQNITISK
jgi:hypothetical protein